MTRRERFQANLDAARTGLMHARHGLEAAKAEGDGPRHRDRRDNPGQRVRRGSALHPGARRPPGHPLRNFAEGLAFRPGVTEALLVPTTTEDQMTATTTYWGQEVSIHEACAWDATLVWVMFEDEDGPTGVTELVKLAEVVSQ